MEYVLYALLAAGVINVACFVIGAKVGQTVARGGNVELPFMNPFKAAAAHREAQAASEEERKRQIILENIDNYDGTGIGQREVR